MPSTYIQLQIQFDTLMKIIPQKIKKYFLPDSPTYTPHVKSAKNTTP